MIRPRSRIRRAPFIAWFAALLPVGCGAEGSNDRDAMQVANGGSPAAGGAPIAEPVVGSPSNAAGGGTPAASGSGGADGGDEPSGTGGEVPTGAGGADVGAAGVGGEPIDGPVEPPVEPCGPLPLPLPGWTCPAGPYAEFPLIESGEESILCTSEVDWAEGPLWSASAQTLYFSSFDERDEAGFFDGSLMTFRQDEGCLELFANIGTNGLAPGPDGFVFAGRQTNRTVSLVNLDTGHACALVDSFEGKRFSSPNDIAVRADGNLYFTDPAWNLGEREEELPQSLYRIDPAGELSLVEVFAEQRPNGVSLSPDGALLYVAILDSVQVYDVDAAGSPANRRQFVPGRNLDGMAIDCAGNVYLSSGHVYSPLGELLGEFWGGTNLAFGGPDGQTLFITGHGRLTSLNVAIPGMPY